MPTCDINAFSQGSIPESLEQKNSKLTKTPKEYKKYFQGLILIKDAVTTEVGMLGDMFLWLVANLKQGVIYFIKQALPPNISAGSV